MEVLLNINDLKYKDLFKKITMSFEEGTVSTISGANNSGKTTLVRILDRRINEDFNINLNGKDYRDYSLEDYSKLVQVVYPNKYYFCKETPTDEIKGKSENKKKERVLLETLKELEIDKKEIEKLDKFELLWLQILKAIAISDKIVVIDSLDYDMTKLELDEVYDFIKKVAKVFKMSFIMTSLSLEEALNTDKIYIIQDGEVILWGEPRVVLQKDNILNKAGLEVPFMIDLSVKLRDYDLVEDIILDKGRLIDSLWN